MARLATTADVYNAIAEPRRRQIIDLLRDGEPWTVGDIVARVRVGQPTVSKHVGVLRAVGVLSVTKSGRHRLYRLNARPLKSVHDWAGTFEQYWTNRLARIKRRAEEKSASRGGRTRRGDASTR